MTKPFKFFLYLLTFYIGNTAKPRLLEFHINIHQNSDIISKLYPYTGLPEFYLNHDLQCTTLKNYIRTFQKQKSSSPRYAVAELRNNSRQTKLIHNTKVTVSKHAAVWEETPSTGTFPNELSAKTDTVT